MPDDPIAPVLNFVNELRAAYVLGEPLDALPKGTQCSSCWCPIACALEPATVDVSSMSIYFWKTKSTERMPLAAVQFVKDFDAGHYPELVA